MGKAFSFCKGFCFNWKSLETRGTKGNTRASVYNSRPGEMWILQVCAWFCTFVGVLGKEKSEDAYRPTIQFGDKSISVIWNIWSEEMELQKARLGFCRNPIQIQMTRCQPTWTLTSCSGCLGVWVTDTNSLCVQFCCCFKHVFLKSNWRNIPISVTEKEKMIIFKITHWKAGWHPFRLLTEYLHKSFWIFTWNSLYV